MLISSSTTRVVCSANDSSKVIMAISETRRASADVSWTSSSPPPE